jgi:hypothetical protein
MEAPTNSVLTFQRPTAHASLMEEQRGNYTLLQELAYTEQGGGCGLLGD